jgi:hypothetical protein
VILRVILHAGFHKTGTSHVQRTLRANARALAPYVALRLKRDIKPLMQATRSFSSLRDVDGLVDVAAAFSALLQAVPKAPCLVIAAEELSGHMPGRPQVPDYGAAPILAELYANAIHARWPEAQIIFHYGTRAADDWLRSAYWEHVKSSSMAMDIDAFRTRYAPAAGLDAVVDQVAELGLTVHRTPLETAAGAFGPAGGVLTLCDVPQGLTLIPQAPHNTRLPQAVLLDLLAANRAYPERAALKAAKAAILAKAGI